MFLSQSELKELSGFKQKRKIIAWLDQQGYRYRINGKGWPSVLRDVVILDLQGRLECQSPPRRRPQLRLD
jgi:hypothetical protein